MMPRNKGHLNNGAADREELGLVTKRLQGKLKHGEKGGLAKEIFFRKNRQIFLVFFSWKGGASDGGGESDLQTLNKPAGCPRLVENLDHDDDDDHDGEPDLDKVDGEVFVHQPPPSLLGQGK